MHYGKDGNPLFIKQLGSLWDKVGCLKDYTAFRQYASNSILVAFDLEGDLDSVNEIGLAIAHVPEARDHDIPPFDGHDLDGFIMNNAIDIHTIKIQEHIRAATLGPCKYGTTINVPEDGTTRALQAILSPLKATGKPLILVGFGMFSEFKWMGKKCPSLLTFFEYWIDLQDVVNVNNGDNPGKHVPSLDGVMESLAGEIPRRRPHHTHRAATDATKFLAITSRFLAAEHVNFVLTPKPRTKLRTTKPRSWCCKKQPFRARITAANGSPLSAHASNLQALDERFRDYDLKIILVELPKHADGRIFTWWISARTLALLTAFADTFNDSIVDGQRLKVEKFIVQDHGAKNPVVERSLENGGESDASSDDMYFPYPDIG